MMKLIAALALVGGLCCGSVAHAEPNWETSIRIPEEYRDMPWTQRPYRPFHFMGNTVRRMHYRGNPLPKGHDIKKTFSSIGR
ncbi:hypothetical protein [Lignipirellula cremea]|uniref:Uncharacterized protein n=1 Tax=Lignipirellula cremea TaxID=2528010 RepID=A0A518DV84_9BACT|nr:hypothetical protein [Lignipirellula cremea]QDU95743.1 hypothetical protein Pla8534_35600 [Lignipirellula cremea]